MIKPVPNLDEMVSRAVIDTAFLVSQRLGSDARAARLLGITRSAFTQYRNGCTRPLLKTACRLAWLASNRYDIELLPDVMSSAGKRTMPVPLLSPNGTITDEVTDNAEAIGQAIAAFRRGALGEAERHAKAAIGALHRLLAEIDARRGYAPSGDTLPNPSTLTIR